MKINLGKKNRKRLFLSLAACVITVTMKMVTGAVEADVSNNWSSITLVNKVEQGIELIQVKNGPVFPCESMQNRIDAGEYAEIVATVRDGDFEYQMWQFSVPEIPLLVGVTQTNLDRSVCIGIAVSGYEPPGTPITETLALPVARKLTLGSMQTQIEREGGIEAYQSAITQSFYVNAHGYESGTGDDDVVADLQFQIDSVTIWAFDQLGIELPEGRYTVVDIDNAYVYQ